MTRFRGNAKRVLGNVENVGEGAANVVEDFALALEELEGRIEVVFKAALIFGESVVEVALICVKQLLQGRALELELGVDE